jgi:ribosomal protein S8
MNPNSINFLNRLKMCSLSSHQLVRFEWTNLTASIARKLYQEGFIQSYKIVHDPKAKNDQKRTLEVSLRYYFDKPILRNVKIISSPGEKTVLKYEQIARMSTKRDVMFFSTPHGILTADECKKAHCGGTLFFIC